MKNEIRYSKKIPGSAGNYHWPVSFDANHGFIGIRQYTPEGIECVLLNRAQVQALLGFCRNAA